MAEYFVRSIVSDLASSVATHITEKLGVRTKVEDRVIGGHIESVPTIYVMIDGVDHHYARISVEVERATHIPYFFMFRFTNVGKPNQILDYAISSADPESLHKIVEALR